MTSSSFGSAIRIFSGTLEVKQWTLFRDLNGYKYGNPDGHFDNYHHVLVSLSEPYACVWFKERFTLDPTNLNIRSFNKAKGGWERDKTIYSGTLEELTDSYLKYILLDEKSLFLDSKHQLYEKVIRKMVTLYDDKEQRKLLVVPRADIDL